MEFTDNHSLFLFFVLSPFLLIYAIALWRLFERAGEKGWKALIPIYNFVVWLKILGRPKWWVLLLFVPGIDILIGLGIVVDTAKCYGKNKFYQQALAILVPFFYFLYISFKSETKYLGHVTDLPKGNRSSSREWADAILFAVAAATLIRWLLLEAFVIPTPSMEKSLLVGDYLFVSKVNYGARTPKTPLQIPLTHQTIWGTKIPSYSTLIQLPQYRLPGLSHVKNNDVVVFNWPADNEYPVDLKTNYIKRCMGVAGDTLEVKNLQVYINGKPAANPPQMQFRYFLTTDDILGKGFFRKHNITEFQPENNGYLVYITEEIAEKLRGLNGIKSVSRIIRPKEDAEPRIFPNSSRFPWNEDFFGPLWIPKKGATIKMTPDNIILYGSTIQNYEGWDEVQVTDDKLVIDGKPVTEYTFQQNYYFMMGDNRHNSLDSRYWGFVPEDHIVGKALFIWLSVDQDPGASLAHKVRWNRIFNLIK